MRTVDFQSQLAPNGQITVPPEVASQVPAGAPIQVVLQWGATDEDAIWRAAGRLQFEAAYDTNDSVYESLAHDDFTP